MQPSCEWQKSVYRDYYEYFSLRLICIIVLNSFYIAGIDLQKLLAF